MLDGYNADILFINAFCCRMYFFSELLVGELKAVRNDAVENKVGMSRALYDSQVVDSQPFVYLSYLFRKTKFYSVYGFVLGYYRVHMYYEAKAVDIFYFPFDVVYNIVHDYGIIFGCDLGMNARELAARAVVVYHKVVCADNTVVTLDFILDFGYELSVRRFT